MTFTKRLTIMTVGVVTLAAATACGGSGSAEPVVSAGGGISPQLVEAAKSEGTLTLYHSPTEDSIRKWAEGFTKEYGIKVEQLRAGSNELFERFSTEFRAGQEIADVLLKSDPQDFVTAKNEEMLANYTPENDKSYDPKVAVSGYYYPGYSLTYAFAYNPAKLNPEELKMVEETGAKAFSDPRFKGRIAVNNANVAETTTATYYIMANRLGSEYGWPWLEGVAANQPKIYDSSNPMADRLVAGEFALAFPFPDTAIAPLVEAGAPIRWFYPEESPVSTNFIAISAKAAHPNAARLFMEWATSAEANSQLANVTQGSPNHSEAKDTRTITQQTWYKPPAKIWSDWPTDATFAADKEAFLKRVGDVFQYAK
jgi:iron(III) transport system substrate-binding protein